MQHPNENQGWLGDIAVRAGALRRCDRHHLVYGGAAEHEERAYKMATAAWNAQSAGCSLQAFRDELKWVLEQAPPKCPLCAK